MDEWLKSMRADAQAEVLAPDAERADDERVDHVLHAFFSDTAETEAFEVALDTLARHSVWNDAPAGKAAASAQGLAPDRRSNVVLDALGVPRPRARQAIEQTLAVTKDAADLLLDRPVGVLLTFDPARVRRMAAQCERVPGELFGQIAASWRGSGGHVYAYRPGIQPATPARRVTEPPDAASVLEWGYRFFALERGST